jgi:hypothetical protein
MDSETSAEGCASDDLSQSRLCVVAVLYTRNVIHALCLPWRRQDGLSVVDVHRHWLYRCGDAVPPVRFLGTSAL